ncbi:MAG: hypothetical protein KA797_01015 [Chitinophagales bacterium]|nr:hypothetical protein [Chitinophagales bacterium]
MKYLFLLSCFILQTQLFAQSKSLTDEQLARMEKFEKGLEVLGEKFTKDSLQDNRQKAMYRFVMALKESLKTDNSFQFPFENVKHMSIINAPDKSFRVFTMMLLLDNQTCRHFGAIQLNRTKLKLIPLYDMSDTFPLYPYALTTTNRNWWGQEYFNIVQKKIGKKNGYFMFGYDHNDLWSKKKIIEPMFIVNDSTVSFGAPTFEITEDDKKRIQNKFVLEYKKDASTTMNYQDIYKAIVFDHTHPEDEKLEGMYFTYIPDGTYEAFVWKKNKWIWVEKFAINNNPSMDTAPIPSPQGKSGRLK